jgi:hypothetical protein
LRGDLGHQLKSTRRRQQSAENSSLACHDGNVPLATVRSLFQSWQGLQPSTTKVGFAMDTGTWHAILSGLTAHKTSKRTTALKIGSLAFVCHSTDWQLQHGDAAHFWHSGPLRLNLVQTVTVVCHSSASASSHLLSVHLPCFAGSLSPAHLAKLGGKLPCDCAPAE